MKRIHMQSRLEKQGFAAHIAYQRRAFSLCSSLNVDASSLETSWSEAAKEWIENRGHVLINERVFFEPPAYRSILLDDLAARRRNEGDLPGFPLHPAERLLAKSMLNDDAVNASVLSDAQTLKMQEIYTGHLKLNSSAAVIQKFFLGACKERGFVIKKNRCVRPHDLGAISIAIDFGTWADATNLIFIMEIENAVGKKPWRIPFDLFVPGFYCYSFLRRDFDLEYLVFAVLAFVDAFSFISIP